jgi:hypothetical protein
MDAGLQAAMECNADEVILISDGRPVVREGNRSLSQSAILARMREAVSGSRRPVIHTLSTSMAESGFLRKLAEDFAGEYRGPGAPGKL